MCRAEADSLYQQRASLPPTVRLVCIVKEDLDGEVEDFVREVWPDGEVFLDEKMAFFSALGGGSVSRRSLMALLWGFVNPFANLRRDWKRSEFVKHHNLKGDGANMGGLYVVREGGALEWAHREADFGDAAPLDRVLEAARAAAN